jgi:hypothetical protein
MAGTRQRVADRLGVLSAQLNEAVASAIELSLDAGDANAAEEVGGHIDSVVGDIETLRQAMEETQVLPPVGGGRNDRAAPGGGIGPGAGTGPEAGTVPEAGTGPEAEAGT